MTVGTVEESKAAEIFKYLAFIPDIFQYLRNTSLQHSQVTQDLENLKHKNRFQSFLSVQRKFYCENFGYRKLPPQILDFINFFRQNAKKLVCFICMLYSLFLGDLSLGFHQLFRFLDSLCRKTGKIKIKIEIIKRSRD